MSTFQYPTLAASDIINILADAKIGTISPADLAQPTPDFLSALYSSILLYLDAFPEDHGQADFGALELFENPDLHIDSVRTMNLCNKTRQFIAALDCPEKFTLRDLLRPDPRRTELFVGAILNFILYKDTKVNLLRPIVEELTLLDEQGKELEAKISQLNGEIENFNESREREMPLVQEIESKVIELRQSISRLNNEQMSLRASFRQMREKGQEMDDQISHAEFALVEGVQENSTLRSKIVHSPEKLQRALEEEKSVLAEAKNSERSAMQSFQEKTATLEVYTKAHKKMSKLFSQMQTIQEQVDLAKSKEREVKVLKSKLSDEEMEDKALQAKLIELQNKAEQLGETRRKLEKEKDLKCMEASRKLNSVRLEAESRRKVLEARQEKVQALIAQVDAIILEINSIHESGAAKQQELLLKSEEVVKEFLRYSNSIGSLMSKD